MRSTILALLAISTAAALACGGPPPPQPPVTETPSAGDAGAGSTPTPTASADAGAATPAPAPTPAAADFDALSKDKKVEIMMTKVVPNVGKLFKAHDAKKFDKFGCKTCHGDAKEKKKEDVKKVLPKLTFSKGGLEKLQKSKPDMMKLMTDKVLPAMADAIGEKVADKPLDPAAKEGFACSGCHAID